MFVKQSDFNWLFMAALCNRGANIFLLEIVLLPDRNVFNKQLKHLEELFRARTHVRYDQVSSTIVERYFRRPCGCMSCIRR